MADITQFDKVALIPLWAFLLTLGFDCKLVPEEFSKGTTPAWQASCLALSNFLNRCGGPLIGNNNTFSSSDNPNSRDRGNIFKEWFEFWVRINEFFDLLFEGL